MLISSKKHLHGNIQYNVWPNIWHYSPVKFTHKISHNTYQGISSQHSQRDIGCNYLSHGCCQQSQWSNSTDFTFQVFLLNIINSNPSWAFFSLSFIYMFFQTFQSHHGFHIFGSHTLLTWLGIGEVEEKYKKEKQCVLLISYISLMGTIKVR